MVRERSTGPGPSSGVGGSQRDQLLAMQKQLALLLEASPGPGRPAPGSRASRWGCACGFASNFPHRVTCFRCGAPRLMAPPVASGGGAPAPARAPSAGTGKGRSGGGPPGRSVGQPRAPVALPGGAPAAGEPTPLEKQLAQAKQQLAQAKAWTGPLREQLITSSQEEVARIQGLINAGKSPEQLLRSCQDRLVAQRAALVRHSETLRVAESRVDEARKVVREAESAVGMLEAEQRDLMHKVNGSPPSGAPDLDAVSPAQLLRVAAARCQSVEAKAALELALMTLAREAPAPGPCPRPPEAPTSHVAPPEVAGAGVTATPSVPASGAWGPPKPTVGEFAVDSPMGLGEGSGASREEAAAPANKRGRIAEAMPAGGVASPAAETQLWSFASLGFTDHQLAALEEAHKHEELLAPGVVGLEQLQQAIEMATELGMEHQAMILRLHGTALSAHGAAGGTQGAPGAA